MGQGRTVFVVQCKVYSFGIYNRAALPVGIVARAGSFGDEQNRKTSQEKK
jgi:hypothetical protein